MRAGDRAASAGPLELEPVLAGGERGESIHYLRFPRAGSGSLGLRQASGPEASQEFELYAPGFHHVSLVVESEAEVDAVHEAAVAAGAEILHTPRRWPQYHERYYATFLRDPDGCRIAGASHERCHPTSYRALISERVPEQGHRVERPPQVSMPTMCHSSWRSGSRPGLASVSDPAERPSPEGAAVHPSG